MTQTSSQTQNIDTVVDTVANTAEDIGLVLYLGAHFPFKPHKICYIFDIHTWYWKRLAKDFDSN